MRVTWTVDRRGTVDRRCAHAALGIVGPMTPNLIDRSSLRGVLQTELTQAIRERDRHLAGAYPIALAVIANAETLPGR